MAESIERRNIRMQPIPRLQFGFFYIAAIGIGLLPYALTIRSPVIWLGLVATVILAFIIPWRGRRSQFGGEAPSAAEIALGLLGRCAMSATIGMFGIVIYLGVARFLPWVIGWLRWLFDGGPGPDLFTAGVYISAFLVLVFILAMMTQDVAGIINVLYPDRPGQRSPFLAPSTQSSGKWRLALGALGIIAVAALVTIVVYFEPNVDLTVVVLMLDFGLVAVGADYLDAKTLDVTHGTPESAIDSVKMLLEAAGYRVIPRPRTGNEEADSVISILDFLAIRSGDAMAGRVRLRAESPDSDLRNEAASIEPAVWVLEDQLRQQQQHRKLRLRPVLLVLGGGMEFQNTGSASRAGKAARIIPLPSFDEVAAMGRAKDTELLRMTAERLFGPSSVLASTA